MKRRTYLRRLTATSSVVALGSLAGCGLLGDGDSETASDGSTPDESEDSPSNTRGALPFDVTLDGPYRIPEEDPGAVSIYGHMTIEGGPSEWPEGEYYELWKATNGDEPEIPATALFEKRTLSNYKLERSDLGEDDAVAINAHMAEDEEAEPGTTHTFFLQVPDSEQYYTLGELSYDGNAEKRSLEEAPAWTQEK